MYSLAYAISLQISMKYAKHHCSQTTPVQITHVFVLSCFTQIYVMQFWFLQEPYLLHGVY